MIIPELFEALYETSPVFRLVCVPDENTVLPDFAARDERGHVHLDFGEGLPKSIPYIHWDEKELTATLSFNGSEYKVVIPWVRVGALAWGEGVAYFVVKDVVIPLPPYQKKGLRLVS